MLTVPIRRFFFVCPIYGMEVLSGTYGGQKRLGFLGFRLSQLGPHSIGLVKDGAALRQIAH